MFSNKGQSMSINVIIVAALALIVFVLLVLIFTGRINVFQKVTGEQGDTNLATFRTLEYGTCKPTESAEQAYTTDYNKATSAEDKEASKARFRDEISRCKTWNDDKATCQSNSCRAS